MNWAQQHAAIFGHRSADWTETYRIWHRLWSLEGYTPSDLVSAVTAVSRRKKPPNFVSEHFSALSEELRELRVQSLAKKVEALNDTRGVCTCCGNTGHIVVPHHNSWKDNKWTRNLPPHEGYTMAVICHMCRIGEHRNLRGTRLSEYELQHPTWRSEMRQWDEIQNQRTAVSGHNKFRIDSYSINIKRKGDE